jgi:deoxyguanosine kinase
VTFNSIAVEGPPGAGKTLVVQGLAQRLEANTALEEWSQNPFLGAFHEGRPGTAFQVEVFFLLSRFRQQQDLLQRHLFAPTTISDYLLERSKLYSYLNLEDNELLIFEKLFALLGDGVPQPDLVIYLQAPTEVLLRRRRHASGDHSLSESYLQEINRAYNHYFFHYSRTPLLVVNTAELDLEKHPEDFDDLLKQIASMGRGTQYYVPRARS